MMHVLYAMEENALKRFMSVKQDLYEAQKTMSAADVAAAKAEIIQAAQINDIVPDKDISLHYSVDSNGRANIPVTGMLTNSVDPCAAFFGESITTYNFIKQTALDADENPEVKEIYFHFDTNGGHVSGCDAASQVIYNLKKPTVGVNHGAALSAGQWLISQTKKIVDETPTAFSGSVGVAVELISRKKDDEARGIERITLTSTDAPDKRVDFTTKSGQEKIIKELDDLHEVFVQRVAEGRSRAMGTKITSDYVNKNFGNGGVLISKNAMAVGMVDEIMNLKNSTHINNEKSPASAGENKTRFKTMKLDEFLTQNPDARAEYDQRIQASAEKVESRIKAVTPYLGSKEYAKAMPMAVKALTGEVDLSAFKGAIAAFDMLKEQSVEASAQEDSVKPGETPASQPKQPSENGEVTKPEDVASVVATLKNYVKAGI